MEHDEAEEDREYDQGSDVGVDEKKIKGDELADYEDIDYRDVDHLDKYDSKDFDDQHYGPMTVGQRRRAEEDIKRREQYKGKHRNVPDMLLKSEIDSNNVSQTRF